MKYWEQNLKRKFEESQEGDNKRQKLSQDSEESEELTIKDIVREELENLLETENEKSHVVNEILSFLQ